MYWILILSPDAKLYRSLAFFGGDYLFPDQKDDEFGKLMDKRARHLIRYTRNVISMIIVSGLAFVAYPLYSFIVEGEHAVIIPLLIPFTNIEDLSGYRANIIHQIILSYFGLISNFGIETMSCIIIENMLAGVDIVLYSTEKLNKLLRQGKEFNTESARLIKNIFKQLQDIDRYLRVFF